MIQSRYLGELGGINAVICEAERYHASPCKVVFTNMIGFVERKEQRAHLSVHFFRRHGAQEASIDSRTINRGGQWIMFPNGLNFAMMVLMKPATSDNINAKSVSLRPLGASERLPLSKFLVSFQHARITAVLV